MQTGFAKIALALILVGCSSSSNNNSSNQGPDCTTFTACGGNVVGTWRLTKACLGSATNPFAAQCPSSTYQISEGISGTVQFVSDGTYSASTTTSATEDVTLPASCLQGADCAQLQSQFTQTVSAPDAGQVPTMATCTGSASTACTCHVVVSPSSKSTTGTYSTSGNTIILDGTPSSYCVQGSGLLVQDASGMMGGTGTVTLAATKQ